MTYALARKPAFAAMQRAPSERLRPAVTHAGDRQPRAPAQPAGLAVTVTPRAAGAVVVELRRGGLVRAPHAPHRPRRAARHRPPAQLTAAPRGATSCTCARRARPRCAAPVRVR